MEFVRRDFEKLPTHFATVGEVYLKTMKTKRAALQFIDICKHRPRPTSKAGNNDTCGSGMTSYSHMEGRWRFQTKMRGGRGPRPNMDAAF